MTTPTRQNTAVSKTQKFTKQLFQNFFYPVVVGTLRIGGGLIKNGFWLLIAVVSFLLRSFHTALEDLKNIDTNQNQ